MAIMSSRLIRHELCKEELKKIGAKIIEIQGIMFSVSFTINDHFIAYLYHLEQDNTFFLERVKPYSLHIGKFENEEQIVDVIKTDIEQFKNAMNSSNFDAFVEVDDHISQLVRLFEDLYLYYNIEANDLNLINDEINTVLDQIKDIMKHSKRAYSKKDPEFLCDNFCFENKHCKSSNKK